MTRRRFIRCDVFSATPARGNALALERSGVVAQGTRIGRDGRVYVRPDPNDATRVRIGGRTHVLVDGTLAL